MPPRSLIASDSSSGRHKASASVDSMKLSNCCGEGCDFAPPRPERRAAFCCPLVSAACLRFLDGGITALFAVTSASSLALVASAAFPTLGASLFAPCFSSIGLVSAFAAFVAFAFDEPFFGGIATVLVVRELTERDPGEHLIITSCDQPLTLLHAGVVMSVVLPVVSSLSLRLHCKSVDAARMLDTLSRP